MNQMKTRSITAQLTGRSRGAVHWLDCVLRDRAYRLSPIEAGGYWVSRCGIRGHFLPVLHRHVKPAPWCKRCQAMSPRDNQFNPAGYSMEHLLTVTRGHVHAVPKTKTKTTRKTQTAPTSERRHQRG